MMDWLRNVCFWLIIPFANFMIWREVGIRYAPAPVRGYCPQPVTTTESTPQMTVPKTVFNYSYCSQYLHLHQQSKDKTELHQQIFLQWNNIHPKINLINSDEYENFKGMELARIKSPVRKYATLNSYQSETCQQYVTIPSTDKVGACVAVAHSSNLENAALQQRFTSDQKKTGRKLDPVTPKSSGYFRNVAKKKGRESQIAKTKPLFEHLQEIQTEFDSMLARRGIHKGDDIVLMVANDGEIDLFLNFACSCRKHGISLHNVLLVAGSSEIVSIVEATGAMGFHHKYFANVDRKASSGYLDRIFVEMMWYKAFSLWLSLERGYNVLFQDLDLVWFKQPFEYFQQYRNFSGGEYTAFLSDDGQRSLRYTPFYANSGFYYIISTSANINFAYTVMISFDILQATGSHQNVFTFRLMEHLDLTNTHRMFLSLLDFPSGVKYHHDKAYMKNVVENIAHPYMFHMCWTANKGQKLENFKQVKMWYLDAGKCAANTLMPPSGSMFKQILSSSSGGSDDKKISEMQSHKMFDKLAEECCVFEGTL